MFEVGDIVRRTKGVSGDMSAGHIGTVKKILDDEWMTLVEYKDNHLMERFELVERKEKSMEDKVKELNKAFNEIAFKDNKRNLERAKNDVATYKLDINRYQRQLNDLWVSYKNAMNRVKALSVETEKDYTSDMEALLNNKYVVSVMARPTGKVVEITTDYIDIYDEKGNKFKGNKYLLSFDFDDMTCYIDGIDEDYCRKSYWSENDPHPHVDGENGEACWGSAGSMLTENMNNYEIYASFIIVLNFLQQVNTDDPAGAYIRNWDCIDENGEDLDNPYECNYETCCICEYEMDEDDSFCCEDCDDHMCIDHAIWIDNDSKYVCQGCYEDNYSMCDNCSDKMHNDDAWHFENEVYCNDCYNELIDECCECGSEFKKDEMIWTNDEHYCETCHDNKFAYCEDCGDTVEKDDTFCCTECGYTYCTDCREETEGMCEKCYKEQIKESEEE